jgi:hypothetical protein
MSFINNEGSTRREFVKEVAVGAAGVAAAGSLGASVSEAAASAPIPQAGRGSKYGNLVKSIPFQFWPDQIYRQLAVMNGDFLNNNLHVQIGAPAVAGRITPNAPEMHDCDQVMLFLGSNPLDLGELGAQIEFCIGPEKEKHMITTSRPVYIPKGLAYGPITILSMDRRIIVMTVSHTRELRTMPAAAAEKEFSGPAVGFTSRGKYDANFPAMLWQRKGIWHYGADNPDDAGGYIASMSNKEMNFSLLCESINKGPYRFGHPYAPHVHGYSEFLICLGADTDDLAPLGGEINFHMGSEMEPHVFTASTVVMPPGKLPHCPEIVTRVDKPFIFMVLHEMEPSAPGKKA